MLWSLKELFHQVCVSNKSALESWTEVEFNQALFFFTHVISVHASKSAKRLLLSL